MPSENGKGSLRGKEKPPVLKVVLLGNGGVGKSCLMTRYVTDTFDNESYHTIGVEFLHKDVEYYDRIFSLQIWDTAGQEMFKSLRTPFYRGADICILTYSVADRGSYESLTMWRNEFLHYADIPESESFPFIVFGNKCDFSPEQRQVETEEAQTWCDEHGYPFIETSAKTAINVEYAFHLSLENWLKSEADVVKAYVVSPTVDLSAVGERQACC